MHTWQPALHIDRVEPHFEELACRPLDFKYLKRCRGIVEDRVNDDVQVRYPEGARVGLRVHAFEGGVDEGRQGLRPQQVSGNTVER